MAKLHRKNYNTNLDFASRLFKVLAVGAMYTCEAWGGAAMSWKGAADWDKGLRASFLILGVPGCLKTQYR